MRAPATRQGGLAALERGVDGFRSALPNPVQEVILHGDGQAGHDHANLRDARAEFERESITLKLREYGGNVSRTADGIGVERSNLHRKIKALGIETEE